MTAYDINKTIMRFLVKNLAMFGLGLYIFAGEDLPEGEPDVKPTAPSQPLKEMKSDTLAELKKGDANWDNVIKYVTANKSLGLEKIGQQLNRKYKMTPAIKKEIANLINA